MLSLSIGNLGVQFDRDGNRHFSKAGMVDWLGRPVFILAPPYRFHFDLEGRIQRIDGLEGHPWDWLQRTMANDWIYYDKVWEPHRLPEPSGLIGDAYWAVNGRTDLPMLRGHGGLQSGHAAKGFAAFDKLIESIRDLILRRPEVRSESGVTAAPEAAERLWRFLAKAARNDRAELERIADRLHDVHGGMPVLPPDTIHVDYRVLLVKVMDGCPNRCGFCAARGESKFAVREKDDIVRQIHALAEIYGDDLANYNSVVLGECDALASPWVEYAAREAFDAFRCGSSFHAGSNLFLFSTIQTLCDQPDSTVQMLESLPFSAVHINVGFEAATDSALYRLQKQQSAQDVLSGLEKVSRINSNCKKVKASGNFITADGLESDSIVEAIRGTRFTGQIYLSPLIGSCTSEKAARDLHEIRRASPLLRAHLYTMQRT